MKNIGNKGITLIALIITIIILLILAGITIIGLTGNNGLFAQARKSKEETLKAQALEELKIKVMEVQTKKNGEATLSDIVEELANDENYEYIVSLESVASINGNIPDVSNAEKIYVTYKGFKFEINAELNVKLVGKNETNGDGDDDNISVGTETKFSYTGSYQEFEVKTTGYYKIECIGAKGGKSLVRSVQTTDGGYGGYTSGVIKLEKGEKLYVYVGGHGADAEEGKNSPNGYNGGGLGTWDNRDTEAAGAGGGATDIRLVEGNWNDFESLKSRIMVAAGGGGSSWNTQGGAGGGLKGLTNRARAVPGTQTSGYKFGIGQNGSGVGNSNGVAGAGGGYYGGTTSDYADDCEAGAGGSSFVSGYLGCDAIAENSTENNIVHTGQSIHYSNKKFVDAEILDGTNSKIEKMENGCAKITFLGEEYQVKVTKFTFTGNYQEFNVETTGYYKIECIGARGGSSIASGSKSSNGGYGGYTSGVIKLKQGEKIYVYVGGHGADAKVGKDSTNGYNGGGLGTWDHSDDESAGAGGGATDIRLIAGEWNDFESLKSRIMVAAGGGGASYHTEGGAGGGLKGLTNRTRSVPGTQTSGYKFGVGQDGYGTGDSDGVAGSGGGYYGGTTSDYADVSEAGAGGSSFISGYSGCDAIAENSTENNIVHTGQSIHYSNRSFIDGVILDGKSTQIENMENGCAKITFMGYTY